MKRKKDIHTSDTKITHNKTRNITTIQNANSWHVFVDVRHITKVQMVFKLRVPNANMVHKTMMKNLEHLQERTNHKAKNAM